MTIRFFLFGVFGFAVGALAVAAIMHNPQIGRERTDAKAPTTRQPAASEEFEAIERRMRNPRDREWTLIQDMQPCFPGSKLCFLLSGPAAERRPSTGSSSTGS